MTRPAQSPSVMTQRAEIFEEIERRRLDSGLGLLKVYNYYRALVEGAV